MAPREFIAGPNFSGRSQALIERLRQSRGAGSFFIGPYAEAALSGLSSTIADEIEIYRKPLGSRPVYAAPPADPLRRPQSLSGGEQVQLALHCFSVSAYGAVAIDTALEQLDASNRVEALAYLETGDFDVALIDNRTRPAGWNYIELGAGSGAYACDWPRLIGQIEPRTAPAIGVAGLDFRYRKGADIFRDVSVTLNPGRAHRLLGPNGAGKTTFLKILVGALTPAAGSITLRGEAYEPWRMGNRALALATQNPDQQWCGATLREDMVRRHAALNARGEASALTDTRLSALANALGIATLDQHLYELPLAARKRVSWLWPFAGAHPWIMLDEPTIGQDLETRENLAHAIRELCAAGYGVIFVTHDDDFAGRVPHRLLRVENRTITSAE
jgi:energy-coupling factor transporter ATP-binding protein EcfA2